MSDPTNHPTTEQKTTQTYDEQIARALYDADELVISEAPGIVARGASPIFDHLHKDDRESYYLKASYLRGTLADPGWQPISTAPKDGTRVILADKNAVVTGCWHEGHYHKTWTCDWLIDGPGPRLPTHWRHLPPPPVA